MSGYARFHRSLIGHPAFRNDAEAMAFAYMVLRAQWKPTRVRYKGKAIGLNRGQLAMSVRDLADAMDRDKGWVERLLKRLKSETMCETHSETGVLVITICNYEKYQSANDHRETPGKTPDETDARQTQDTEQVREEYKKEEEDASHLFERAPAPALPLPLSEAVADWNTAAAASGWPQVSKFNPARKAALRARLKDDGIEGWRSAIGKAVASGYLAGAPPPQWFNFDWLVKPTNFAKVIDGNYSDERNTGNHSMAGHRGGSRSSSGGNVIDAAELAMQDFGYHRH